jgi:hypothetical protein
MKPILIFVMMSLKIGCGGWRGMVAFHQRRQLEERQLLHRLKTRKEDRLVGGRMHIKSELKLLLIT